MSSSQLEVDAQINDELDDFYDFYSPVEFAGFIRRDADDSFLSIQNDFESIDCEIKKFDSILTNIDKIRSSSSERVKFHPLRLDCISKDDNYDEKRLQLFDKTYLIERITTSQVEDMKTSTSVSQNIREATQIANFVSEQFAKISFRTTFSFKQYETILNMIVRMRRTLNVYKLNASECDVFPKTEESSLKLETIQRRIASLKKEIENIEEIYVSVRSFAILSNDYKKRAHSKLVYATQMLNEVLQKDDNTNILLVNPFSNDPHEQYKNCF